MRRWRHIRLLDGRQCSQEGAAGRQASTRSMEACPVASRAVRDHPVELDSGRTRPGHRTSGIANPTSPWRLPGLQAPFGPKVEPRRVPRPTSWPPSSAAGPEGRRSAPGRGVVVRRERPLGSSQSRDGPVEAARRARTESARTHERTCGVDARLRRRVDVDAADDVAPRVRQHGVGEAAARREVVDVGLQVAGGCARASSARRARGAARSPAWRGCARRSSSRRRGRPRCARLSSWVSTKPSPRACAGGTNPGSTKGGRSCAGACAVVS